MSDTPETQEAVERWRQGKINIFDEMARMERERNTLIDALEYIAGLDSSQAACAELCSAVGVAVKALEDAE